MSVPPEPLETSGPRVPSVSDLFVSFFGISAMGFGGVIPWARWMVVERKGWLTPKEFNEVMTLSQMLPGGNIINMAVVLGHRYQGFSGALAGVLGLIAAPFGIVIGLALIYDRIRDIPEVGTTLEAISAAAVGLIVAMAVKMVITLREEPLALFVAAISFVCIGVLRLPLIATLLVLGPVSIAVAWYRIARARA